MRNCLLIYIIALCCLAAARPSDAQTPNPTLLRITFVAAAPVPTATPEVTPTTTPTIVPTVPTPTITPPAVPEPATLTLFGFGAVAVAYLLRQARRRNRS